MRKTWQKPKLIVLVRGKSEELILQFCKTTGGGGPLSDLADCISDELYCGDCETIGAT